MTDSDPQNSAAPQKRLACDRCHARKLRCFRDASMAECSRCVQRGYVCTYSPPLKSGRPKKGSSAVPKRIQETPGRDSLPDLDNSSLSSSSSISGAEPIGISAPMAYPLHLSAGCEVMNDQIYLSPLETTDPLYHVDAASTSVAPTVLPTTCRDNLHFKWLDMPMDRGDTSHHPNHSHQQHQHRNKSRETPSGDGSTSDVEWDSSLEGLPMNVPYGLHTPDQTPWSQSSTPNGSTLPEIMHSLSRLQQEFVHFRSQSSGGNNPPNTGRTLLPSFYPTFSPVNTILRPGQELVDLISRVFDECSLPSRRGQLPLRLTVDRRTLLPLILTPLSLLLSAYSDLLRDIGTASNQSQNRSNSNHNPCDSYFGSHSTMSITSSPREGFVDEHHQEERSRQHNHTNNNISVSRVSNPECPTSSMPSTPLVPDNLQLTLDAMSLNRPLQLVLVTTVIKHHLTYLGDALQEYQVHHMHGPDLGISESLFSTSITELRSSIKVLLSEAQSLL
ncbi:hypothetical protein PISL3812_07994 [Talaromyces islandicus]|uniref:Zn(2)-C6 fungal-type domain-containing protein n=1 Tax=Talaromyces islandicus TaxID=28573 RepID=A0A0U1M7P9_TALIS|nr:hypothetical protein PISL3812_07994 [Talaromyces islandicus]